MAAVWKHRKRLAGLVLLLVVLAIGARFMSAPTLVHVDIHYRLGDRPVEALDAIVRRPGDREEVARFSTRLVGREVVQRPRLRPGFYEVEITLAFPDGRRRTVSRTIEARKGADITLDLAGVEAAP